ncbi:RNA polymerase sigma factor for flagellar operon [Rubrivivax sp. A210]|uniref:sigma-70 family RNA polymerase sigma factor n=1 Tax=Rubrivivax sp. A210 TaxID=2772301 RepID=UPI0019196697|nr:sigma-70 family RNA polymerase sigma factor [Rubrivivax sp. A210]CAD5372378.1 RNA polymerase sigma factor for flagellar operon [Rubrivivax sp. A210]
MISMQGVPSALIARNESWVRQQAAQMMRRVPSNVEKADLIQVGLIAVAQAALGFKWEGDPETEEAREAFVRYARLRVKGAMVDELRQMDHLERSQRRKVKVIEIARERWQASHGAAPTLGELSGVCQLSIDEVAELEQAALTAQTKSLSDEGDGEDHAPRQEPATPRDEVEARVDTAIVLRRLEKFFAGLPERERQAIDAYLGIGLTPSELASNLNLSQSRVSQLYDSACRRIAAHFGNDDPRATSRDSRARGTSLEELVAKREAELAQSGRAGSWGQLIEETLTRPGTSMSKSSERLVVDSSTRWG